jgi:sugar phosphate isomerase/epimerase
MAAIGLQLYSIKEETERDFFGTLRRVGEIGYDGVEFAGYFGATAADLKALLAEINLLACGSHVGTGILRDDLDNAIRYAVDIDCPALICPGFRVEGEHTFHEIAALFNRAGEACKVAGLRFLYHLHGHEFVQYGDRTGMDILLAETDPTLVGLEPDVFWVEHAGVSAVAFIRQHGDRCPYIHMKDARDRIDWHDTEVGAGVLDMAGIIQAARPFAVEWYVVEQEAFDIPQMDSIAISLQNLRRLTA